VANNSVPPLSLAIFRRKDGTISVLALTVLAKGATLTELASSYFLALPAYHTYNVILNNLASRQIQAFIYAAAYTKPSLLLGAVPASFPLCVCASKAVAMKDSHTGKTCKSAALPATIRLRFDEKLFQQNMARAINWVG